MKKKLKKFFIISGIVFSSLVVLLAAFILAIYFNKSWVISYLERTVSKKDGTHLKIGKLNYGLFPLSVQADSVKVLQVVGGMEIEITMGRLDVKGQLGRILKKKRPFFESIDAAEMTCLIHIKEIEEEMVIDYQQYIRQLADALSYLESLDFNNFSFQYITPFSHAFLEKCVFILSGTGNEGEYAYSLRSEEIELESPSQNLFLAGAFQSSGKLSLTELPSIEAEFSVKPSQFEFRGNTIPIPELGLSMKGEFPLERKAMSFPQLEMIIPAFIDASATLELDMSEETSIDSSFQVQVRDLSRTYALLKPSLKPYLPSQLKSLALDGAAYLEGKYRQAGGSSEKTTGLKGLLRIEPTRMSCEAFSFSVENSVSGELRIEGHFPDVGITGSLDIQDGRLNRGDLNIQDFSLSVLAAGTSSSLGVSRIQGSFKGLSYSSEERKVELERAEFSGKGSFEIIEKKLSLERLTIQALPLAPVEMEAVIDMKPQGERSVHLKTSKLDAERLLTMFSSFIPKEIQELGPAGHFDFDIRANQSPESTDEWNVSGIMNLSGGAFHNASFTFASESLEQKVAFEGRYNSSRQDMEFTADLDLSKGESLWNQYYVDWTRSPFQLKMSGVYRIPLNRLDDLSVETSLFSEGKINVQGVLSFQDPYLLDLKILASRLDLGSLYSFLSQGQSMEEYALEMGGDAETEMRFRKEKEKLSLDGFFWVRNGAIKNKDKSLLIDGIQVEIPFYLETPVQSDDGRDDQYLKKGYFSIQQFKTPALSLEPFQLDLQAGKNRFMFEPLTLDIFGGQATLGRSVLTLGSETANVKGMLSFSLKDLDLSKLPFDSEQFSLEGMVQVDLPRVELSSDEILTEGKAEVNIFDTTIRVENIGVTKPFTKNRTIFCDVRFDDLSLEKLTNTVPFGKVTGILRGEIKDLALSYGQPERFIMLLESVKKKGVSQKFSLGAVNDLSIISSGEGSSLSSNKGFARFVSEFGYEKIGIYCSLKNDSFSLRGTIREKGIEYLVKRSWLFGISVVNKKPKNKIRFRDMMSRLKRVGESEGPTTQKKKGL
jgi:hypothetical protein